MMVDVAPPERQFGRRIWAPLRSRIETCRLATHIAARKEVR